jgi:Flp pilus assembly protein protease CpaA
VWSSWLSSHWPSWGKEEWLYASLIVFFFSAAYNQLACGQVVLMARRKSLQLCKDILLYALLLTAVLGGVIVLLLLLLSRLDVLEPLVQAGWLQVASVDRHG